MSFFFRRREVNPSQVSAGYFFASLVAFCVAIFQFQGDAQVLRDAQTSVKWPMAQGVVSESRIDETTEMSRSGSYSMYKSAVAYNYNVGGQEYTAHRISYATKENYKQRDRGDVEKIQSRFPIGGQVNVHYDPANPSEAVLMPGVDQDAVRLDSMVFFVMGLLFGCLSLFAMLFRGVLQPGPKYTLRMWLYTTLPALVIVVIFGAFGKPMIIKMLVPPSAVVQVSH